MTTLSDIMTHRNKARSIPPPRWYYVSAGTRHPIASAAHLDAWRDILAADIARGIPAHIERWDGVKLYPRPKPRHRTHKLGPADRR